VLGFWGHLVHVPLRPITDMWRYSQTTGRLTSNPVDSPSHVSTQLGQIKSSSNSQFCSSVPKRDSNARPYLYLPNIAT